MKRDAKVYLYDIQKAGKDILEFTKGMSSEEYGKSELVKAAVERKFAVIGEALVRLREDYPDILEQIPDYEKIIGFRNVLVHGYDVIEDATVWSAIESNLRILLEEIKTLLNSF